MFERNVLNKSTRKTKLQYSSATLKSIAAVLTLIGTFGVTILQNGMLKLDNYSAKTLLEAFQSDSGVFGIATAAIFCMGIANFAVPVYSLLLVEGYKHTASYQKYLLRVGVLALISELPYDFAMHGTWFYMDEQNPVIGIFLVLLMIYFVDYLSSLTGVRGYFLKMIIVAAAILWSVMLRVDYGITMVLVTAVLWLLNGNGAFTTFMAATVSLMKFPAPFGFLFNHFYNGEKGECRRWLFYIFYPAQLLVFGLLARLCF